MLKIISFALAVYGVLCVFMYLQQRAMMYFPSSENTASLAQHFWLTSEGQQLKVWQLNQGKDAVLYFGGNAEAVEYNIPLFTRILQDKTVYLVNYRGYGGSSGKPTQQALFTDALAVYDEIESRHATVSVIGRSLGSGVACYLAAQREIDKLVLITPFDSMTRLASTHYPLYPVKWLLKDRFESLHWASKIDSKALLLIAETDRVVPRKHSLKLLDALAHVQAKSVIIPRASHNTISEFAEYRQELEDFL